MIPSKKVVTCNLMYCEDIFTGFAYIKLFYFHYYNIIQITPTNIRFVEQRSIKNILVPFAIYVLA